MMLHGYVADDIAELEAALTPLRRNGIDVRVTPSIRWWGNAMAVLLGSFTRTSNRLVSSRDLFARKVYKT